MEHVPGTSKFNFFQTVDNLVEVKDKMCAIRNKKSTTAVQTFGECVERRMLPKKRGFYLYPEERPAPGRTTANESPHQIQLGPCMTD